MVSFSVCHVGCPGLSPAFVQTGGILPAWYLFVHTCSANWFSKGFAMCCLVNVIVQYKQSLAICRTSRVSHGILSACYQHVPTSADDWFTKGRSMCYHVCVIMHVKDSQLSVVRVGHHVPLAGFCLFLYTCI